MENDNVDTPYLVIDDSFDRPPPYTRLADPIIDHGFPNPEHPGETLSPVHSMAVELVRRLASMASEIESLRRLVQTLSQTSRGPNAPRQGLTEPFDREPVTGAAAIDNILDDYRASHIPTLTTDQIERFTRRVIRTSEHWIWRGGFNPISGRGITRIGTRVYYAHRVQYTLHTGRNLDNMKLKLTCGEALCVQPNHHRLGELGASSATDGFDRDHNDIPDDPFDITQDAGIMDDAGMLPLGRSVSTEMARSTQIARNRHGVPKICHKGHTKTIQPNGAHACRICDRDRKPRVHEPTSGPREVARELVATARLSRELDREMRAQQDRDALTHEITSLLSPPEPTSPQSIQDAQQAPPAPHLVPSDLFDDTDPAGPPQPAPALPPLDRLRTRGLSVVLPQ